MKQRQVNPNQRIVQNVQFVAAKQTTLVPPQRAYTSHSGQNAQYFVGYGGPQFLKGTQMLGAVSPQKKLMGNQKNLQLTKNSNVLQRGQARISEEQEFLQQISRFKESIDLQKI